eukprot:SAG11_NODE_18230_length_496_cov_3.259446_1_plen_139_part_10
MSRSLLGPDIGFVNVFEYHDDDGTCQLSMEELATVCADFYLECINFLASSEETAPECDPVFLGPDIGLVSVFEFHDDDGTCQLSMQELANVCSDFFQECMSFLESSEQEPQCEQVFLGPDIGFVSVFEYHDDDGTCQLS